MRDWLFVDVSTSWVYFEDEDDFVDDEPLVDDDDDEVLVLDVDDRFAVDSPFRSLFDDEDSDFDSDF